MPDPDHDLPIAPSLQHFPCRPAVEPYALPARELLQVWVIPPLLPADALLGRATDAALERAQAAVQAADVLVVATPVYRATYSGLLKVFLDLLPNGALAGAVVVPVVTGGGLAHLLAIDHGVRPLVASLGAVVVSAGVYGTDAQFHDGAPEPELLARVDRAVDEAVSLARARLRARTASLLDSNVVAESEV